MTTIKNFIKYIVASVSITAFAGSFAFAMASMQVNAAADIGVSANVSASSTMVGHVIPGARRTGSTTRMMSSTTREEKLAGRQNAAISRLDMRSADEISARIDALNKISSRVNAMVKLSADQKTAITTEIQNLVSDLTSLQTKIQLDASSTSVGSQGALSSTSPLRMDIQSIAKNYRIYALVIPQVEILAAADRAETIVASLNVFSAKLQTRIAAAQSAGKNVASLQTSLTDMNTKTSDAQVQATAAITATANLTPDNGDTTLAASNSAALKTGRADIKTANTDIRTAVADARSIVKGVEGFGNVSASTTTSVSASTTQ